MLALMDDRGKLPLLPSAAGTGSGEHRRGRRIHRVDGKRDGRGLTWRPRPFSGCTVQEGRNPGLSLPRSCRWFR